MLTERNENREDLELRTSKRIKPVGPTPSMMCISAQIHGRWETAQSLAIMVLCTVQYLQGKNIVHAWIGVNYQFGAIINISCVILESNTIATSLITGIGIAQFPKVSSHSCPGALSLSLEASSKAFRS